MKFPLIRFSYLLNLVILVVSLAISFFTLPKGINGIDFIINPELKACYIDVIITIAYCCIGVAFLLIAFASIRGILYKYKVKKNNLKE